MTDTNTTCPTCGSDQREKRNHHHNDWRWHSHGSGFAHGPEVQVFDCRDDWHNHPTPSGYGIEEAREILDQHFDGCGDATQYTLAAWGAVRQATIDRLTTPSEVSEAVRLVAHTFHDEATSVTAWNEGEEALAIQHLRQFGEASRADDWLLHRFAALTHSVPLDAEVEEALHQARYGTADEREAACRTLRQALTNATREANEQRARAERLEAALRLVADCPTDPTPDTARWFTPVAAAALSTKDGQQ